MKKLFLGAAVAMSSLAFAQQFGAKAGLNVSSLSKTEGVDEKKAKVGFNAGVFMNMPIAESFSFQPELLYSQMGEKNTTTSTVNVLNTTITTKETGTIALDYVTLPLMFQYNATPAFYLEAGPEFGLLVSGKAKGDEVITTTDGTSTTTSTSSYSQDLDKDRMNTFNIGVGLGAGYYFTPNIGITARYVAGFTDIAKDRPSGDAVKNNVFQAGLAYKF
jgi:opacity protein-like surface antigen